MQGKVPIAEGAAERWLRKLVLEGLCFISETSSKFTGRRRYMKVGQEDSRRCSGNIKKAA